jgi:hypothetical protein
MKRAASNLISQRYATKYAKKVPNHQQEKSTLIQIKYFILPAIFIAYWSIIILTANDLPLFLYILEEDTKMDVEKFGEELKKLGKRVEKIKNNINTEEATKTSLVMPFFQILGYDIFDPTEFVPEFTADVGIKKGEKVDYAIMLNSQPVILIEAKAINEQLTKHDSQLFRYFGTTTSKFGILTNGEEYKFFTDLEEQNKMDITPFLIVNISNIKDSQIPEVAKFHKDNFDIENIVSTASELKYLNNLKIFLNDQMNTPSEEFTKYLVGEIYDGVKTKSTLDKFKPIIKKGLAQFINERVNEKLSAALNTSAAAKEEIIEPIQSEPEIITTAEEMETFTIVKIPTLTVYRRKSSHKNRYIKVFSCFFSF